MTTLEVFKNAVGLISAAVAAFSIGRVFYVAFTAPVRVERRHSLSGNPALIQPTSSTGVITYTTTGDRFSSTPIIALQKDPEKKD